MANVELIYLPENDKPFHRYLSVSDGATIQDAIVLTSLYERYPETRSYPVGIFAQKKAPDTLLKEGDRIEIYRPLTLDPKVKRRLRVKAKQ